MTRKRYPLMVCGMLKSLLMEDEAETAVEEKIFGRRRDAEGTEDFGSGRILEAPCPPLIAGALGIGPWLIAESRPCQPAQVGKPQGAHGPQLIPWVGCSGPPIEGRYQGSTRFLADGRSLPRAQERKGGGPGDRPRPQRQRQARQLTFHVGGR